ncbi:MAG: YfcE family phosphodiesterase [Treponema sp.]|nr:YfcE family phosphodiesterase [Treponema sp.]
MTSFVQNEDKLIASPQALKDLEKKDQARLLISSDSHGDYKILQSIIRQFGPDCDAFIFCGDGAGDIAKLLESARGDGDLAKAIPPVMAFVRGNCDPDLYPLSDAKYLKFPDYQTLNVNGQKILITHGHNAGVNFGLQNLAYSMQLQESKLAFYGHTHIARQDNFGEYKIVNPGSCSKPRGGQAAGFAIATLGKNFVDIAFIKIISSGGECKSFEVLKNPY